MTIGVEFGSCIVPVGPAEPEQQNIKLSIWDTAGQETYKSITRSYFRGASGALLVFDITRRNTFDSVTQWLNDLRQIAEEGIVVVLVGNKSDLTQPSSEGAITTQRNQRAVTREEAEAWCRENGVMQYLETSAKSGDGVEHAFLEVANRIYRNIQAGKYDLTDRRSGVKGPGAANSRQARSGGRGGAVVLGMNDVTGMRSGKSSWGNCC